MTNFKTTYFPKSRIATNDVCAVGIRKHHIAAMLEIDVTESRKRIRQLRRDHMRVSFTAWLIKAISGAVKAHPGVAAYSGGKRKVIIFDRVNVSIAVEKEIDGHKVPIPLIIEKADERSLESISRQIDEARIHTLTREDIVLHRKSKRYERLYYVLPGFVRRLFWRYLTGHPHLAFRKMGNVAVTSVGMIGRANGWFIPISVHPVCFGIGNIAKKPAVIRDKIEIREIMNMSVLLDHDVADGADMARFITDLSNRIETGKTDI